MGVLKRRQLGPPIVIESRGRSLFEGSMKVQSLGTVPIIMEHSDWGCAQYLRKYWSVSLNGAT